jgi:hypothetical protein
MIFLFRFLEEWEEGSLADREVDFFVVIYGDPVRGLFRKNIS